jgi:hypothetical protein
MYGQPEPPIARRPLNGCAMSDPLAGILVVRDRPPALVAASGQRAGKAANAPPTRRVYRRHAGRSGPPAPHELGSGTFTAFFQQAAPPTDLTAARGGCPHGDPARQRARHGTQLIRAHWDDRGPTAQSPLVKAAILTWHLTAFRTQEARTTPVRIGAGHSADPELAPHTRTARSAAALAVGR